MKNLKEIITKVPSKALIVFALLAATFSCLLYIGAINIKNSTGDGIANVQIAEGTGVRQIGRDLKSQGVIRFPILFFIYVRLNNLVIQAGNYEIAENLSLVEVVSLLSHGTTDLRLTIIEGLRAEEIGELLDEKLENFEYETFMNTVVTNSLEGKLFPDTYFVVAEETTEGMITLLTQTYNSKTKDLFEGNKTSLTEAEILTLASIVEREEPSSSERPTVAGILISRYVSGEIIGADATTQYAVGEKGNWWSKALTQTDLDSDSPFNTRKVAGLPPAPICNPSVSAIESVLGYKMTDYKYYMHDKEGVVHYARTLEEHIENQRKYPIATNL